MSMIVPNTGKLQFLTVLISNILSGALLHLYSNNHTPAAGDTLGNYTECTFTGYSSVSLSSWSSPTINGSSQGTSTAGPGSFTPTSGAGSGNIYGYYITDSTSTYLLGAELFAGGPIVVPQSVTLQVTNTFLDASIF